jgi:hypothetical protein
MKPDDLDRILSEEQEILPSSGFTASVMEAVRLEASALPPIPFPWKQVVPGLVASILMLAVLGFQVYAQPQQGGTTLQPASPWMSAFSATMATAVQLGAHWVLAALLLAFASVKFAMRLAASES